MSGETLSGKNGTIGAGIRSMAVCFPNQVRTNDFFRELSPELVANAKEKALARLWQSSAVDGPTDTFSRTMEPYASDPFRGTVARRVLGDQESLTIEIPAAKAAVAAAGMEMGEIDLLLSCAFAPDHFGIGNGIYLVRALGLECPAWNFETACSSPIAGLTMASAMVKSGQFKKILITLSCNYTKFSPLDDTIGWFLGDGAAAFVVTPQPSGVGLIGQKSINTVETITSFRYSQERDEDKNPVTCIRTDRTAGRVLAETAEPYLLKCCHGALDDAGVSLDEIDAFVFTTPTAWYADFCAATLGVDRSKTIDCYPFVSNVGPVLVPTNLYYAARQGLVKPGSLVLLFGVGSVSSAGAAVVRWGDVSLGLGAPDFEPN